MTLSFSFLIVFLFQYYNNPETVKVFKLLKITLKSQRVFQVNILCQMGFAD